MSFKHKVAYMLQSLVIHAELLGHAQARALQQRAQVRLHLQYLLQLQHLFDVYAIGRQQTRELRK
jgi:hypothetical protein